MVRLLIKFGVHGKRHMIRADLMRMRSMGIELMTAREFTAHMDRMGL